MIIRHPNQSDWEHFSTLASSENWRVPRSELQLFKGSWSQYAHVLDDDGFCGLVTSVAYEKSAWIGNLIVPQDLRGKGYGSHMFNSVLTDLIAMGMASVWLTASNQGRSIYEKEGFVDIERIERWVLPPSGTTTGCLVGGGNTCEDLIYADQLAWGDNRGLLLSVLCDSGKVFTVDGAITLLQTGPDVQIIGPWYAHETSIHSQHDLLMMVLAAINPRLPAFVDLFASSSLQALCESAGFQFVGSTYLMANGDIGEINLSGMVSLASLGSMG